MFRCILQAADNTYIEQKVAARVKELKGKL